MCLAMNIVFEIPILMIVCEVSFSFGRFYAPLLETGSRDYLYGCCCYYADNG